MAWTLGGVTIHPGDKAYRRNRTANIAQQDVLDNTTEVLSYYGGKSRRVTLNFVVFGSENSGVGVDTLETAVVTDADVALVSDQGAIGNYRILSLDSTRILDTSRSTESYECVASMIKV